MKNKKKRTFLKILVLCLSLIIVVVISFSVIFIKTTWNTSLDVSKLDTVKNVNKIVVYDNNKSPIDTNYMFSGSSSVMIDELPSYVKQAFIATEDKRFYKHNGVDYKRIIGAAINNIKNKSFSQGASTISQQLIKNTHLTREKTINRKLKEIKLAYQLEKEYTKDEILEMYLNNIYFGNGCYGIEKASNFYYAKPASELSLGEAAMLVSTVNAPSVYDPINKNDNAEKRKKLVLKLMYNQGFISNEEYEKSAKNKENVVKNIKNQTNLHLKAVLDEVCRVLKISKNQLKNMNLNIDTYIDVDLQKNLSLLLSDENSPKNSNNVGAKMGALVIDNRTKGIVAVSSSVGFDALKDKRQPGSTIKPVLVYAPAFEYGLIYPDTVIIDEKININGYSPSNANKTFLGEVSVRESVEKSLNIPAVKTLSKVGIERAKNFAEKLGFTFSSEDKNMALALGGMTEGVSLKQIADAYSGFACNGLYKSSSIIKKITDDNGVVLYEDNKEPVAVMSSGTAGLITDVLKGVVSRGTARRLNSLGPNIASKTGTVGLTSSSENTDAFNVAYTKDYTVVSWFGSTSDKGYMNSSVNGSTYPTLLSKNILSGIYKNKEIPEFDESEDLVYKYIDVESLKVGEVKLADQNVSINNKRLALFNKNQLPEYSKNYEITVPVLEVTMEENEKPTLTFESKLNHEYVLYRNDIKLDKEEEIKRFLGEDKSQIYTDKTAKSGKIYEYYLKIKRKELSELKESNSIKLMSF